MMMFLSLSETSKLSSLHKGDLASLKAIAEARYPEVVWRGHEAHAVWGFIYGDCCVARIAPRPGGLKVSRKMVPSCWRCGRIGASPCVDARCTVYVCLKCVPYHSKEGHVCGHGKKMEEF